MSHAVYCMPALQSRYIPEWSHDVILRLGQFSELQDTADLQPLCFKIQAYSFRGKQVLPDLHDPLASVDPKLPGWEHFVPASRFCNDLDRTGFSLCRNVHCRDHCNTSLFSLAPEIPAIKVITHNGSPPVQVPRSGSLCSQSGIHGTGSPRSFHPDSMSARIRDEDTRYPPDKFSDPLFYILLPCRSPSPLLLHAPVPADLLSRPGYGKTALKALLLLSRCLS